MFEYLGDRLSNAIKNIKGMGRITEDNISEAMREIRMALLEADVNYEVVKEFVKTVKEKALGMDVSKSLKPEEVFINKKEIKLKDIRIPLEIGYNYLLSHEKELNKFNPENRWGHYENFVYWLPDYIRACYKWPNAVLEISR